MLKPLLIVILVSREATMNSCAGKWHSDKALVVYIIITALCVSGLLSSGVAMFVHVLLPTCRDGTTTTPYGGVTAPNAPTSNDKPFCTNDAASKSFATTVYSYGYTGLSTGFWNGLASVAVSEYYPFVAPGPNSTCPTASSEGADSITATAAPAGGAFVVQNFDRFASAFGQSRFAGGPSSSPSVTGFNNFPVEISGSTGKSSFFVRNLNPQTLSFQVAKSTTGLPENSIPNLNLGSAPYKVTFTPLSDCASQQNVNFRMGPGDSSFSSDGTLKDSRRGICLTEQTGAGVLAVPGLLITTIVLLLILDLLMWIPVARKFRLFNVVFIVISVLCIIFLIAAVASGATNLLGRAGPCSFLASMTEDQLKPSPTLATLASGYTPSSGGYSLNPTGAQGKWNGSIATYASPILILGPGAALIVASIVLLFVFVIVFAIKSDWAGEGDNGVATATMMTPR